MFLTSLLSGSPKPFQKACGEDIEGPQASTVCHKFVFLTTLFSEKESQTVGEGMQAGHQWCQEGMLQTV